MIAGIGLPELVILAPIIIGIIGYYVLVRVAAKAKGRPFWPWAILCTVTGPIALIVMVVLPPVKQGG